MSIALSEYHPEPELKTPRTPILRASQPVIDAHNHYSFWTRSGGRMAGLLELMDELNIEKMVNIINREDPYESYALTEQAHPDRFISVALLDLSDPDDPGFAGRVENEIRRLRGHGFHGLKVWKSLGLKLRDRAGRLVMPDDERLLPFWHAAAAAGLPIVMHLADPAAFFKPLDGRNERYEELKTHPDWHFHGGDYPAYGDLLAAQERLLARETAITFILAHVGASAENLDYAGTLLERYPHVNMDISARIAELGRQPYTARDFCLRHEDRILFGLDETANRETYRLAFRFMETRDEYFPYSPAEPPPQGRWYIYGLDLPPATLAKIYRGNAVRLLAGT